MTFPGLARLSSLTLLCLYHTLATGLVSVSKACSPFHHRAFAHFLQVCFCFLNYFTLEYI